MERFGAGTAFLYSGMEGHCGGRPGRTEAAHGGFPFGHSSTGRSSDSSNMDWGRDLETLMFRALSRWARLTRLPVPVLIEIDGGVSASNAGDLFAAGCDALVAGSAVFGAADPKAEIVKMLEAQSSR